MSITAYGASAILNKVLGGYAFSFPTSFYLGLSTTSINYDGTGKTEPVGNGYARKEIPISAFASFGVTSTGTITNTLYVFMNTLTGTWGTLSYMFLIDDLNNIWFYDTLSSPITPVTGEFVLFAPGDLAVSAT